MMIDDFTNFEKKTIEKLFVVVIIMMSYEYQIIFDNINLGSIDDEIFFLSVLWSKNEFISTTDMIT